MALCLLGLCACNRTGKGGPYSHVLKAYALYEQTGQIEDDFAQGFQMLAEGAFAHLDGTLGETLYYAFYDMDGDGTEELLLGKGYGAELPRLIEVYAIQGGIAVQQPFRVSRSADDAYYLSPSLLDNGIIWSFYDNGDGSKLCYWGYRFEDGQLKLQMKLARSMSFDGHDYSYEGNAYFRGNVEDAAGKDTPIGYEEYERLWKEFAGDGQSIEIDWKPLAAY